MAFVTQRVPHYLGGVSKQPDDKKALGQVKEALNAYPDPTYGLQKRPGLKFLTHLKKSDGSTKFSGTDLDNAKWFYIHRDGDEKYVGCIVGHGTAANADIHVWNATSKVKATITFGANPTEITANKTYLHATQKKDYDVLTVQDSTIITNKIKTVDAGDPNTFNPNRQATIRLLGVDTATGTTYKVNYKLGTDSVVTKTATIGTGGVTATAASILGELHSQLNAVTGITSILLNGSLELTATSDLTITTDGGIDGKQLSSYGDQVTNVAELPTEAVHGRTVRIINTAGADDDFYAKFVADDADEVWGEGYWEETLGHGMSPGLVASSMPHELVNTGTDAFTFRPITWTNRLVGDDTTNPHPSFVGKKIQQAFFNDNRLGFLSEDNVIMSQAGEFHNFYHITAKTLSAADPIDLNCSSTRPAVLHGIIPVASGLMLFSANQQFVMYSADGNLSPQTAMIRGLSNYEMDTDIDPVDVGTSINFVSKTAVYTRVFSMNPKGEGETPEVINLGKVVDEYIPETIDSLIASPQNSFIALYGSTLDTVYFHRIFPEAENLRAWYSWKFPGNVLDFVVDSDTLYTVVKVGTGSSARYSLLTSNLSATLIDEAITTADGLRINPYMDFYAKASSVVNDNGNSKCYLPFDDIVGATPKLVISGDVVTNYTTDIQSGFSPNVSRVVDGGTTYFLVKGEKLQDIATSVIVGYTFDYEVELPQVHYQIQGTAADYSAVLNVSRMKFSVGRSSTLGFKLSYNGYRGNEQDFSKLIDGSETEFTFPYKVEDISDLKVRINGRNRTDFTVALSAEDKPVITMNTAPENNDIMLVYEDTWYDIQPIQGANLYLADDVAILGEAVYTIPIHQRSGNFSLKVFSDSPFPVSLTSMMWEGNYSPRYYRRN